MEHLEKKVLVTGASGFIALHCIKRLLNSGFKVRGSLREIKRENEIRKYLGMEFDKEQFEICKLDLLKDEGWKESMKDCSYLFHIASPCITKEPKNENEIIQPAVEGTIRALKFAQNSEIKKVIVTSSIASIVYGHNKNIYSQYDWTDNSKNLGAYIKSKTLADKAAWDFFNNIEFPTFKMTSIHPGLVFGPLFNLKTSSSSANLIIKMIKGEYPALPNIYFSVVDVRDVAKLHVESIYNEESDSKRIIVTSPKSISFLSISRNLRDLGYEKAPLKLVPNSLIHFLSFFSKDMKTSSLMIKKGYFNVDISQTISIYDWEPINFNETMKEMSKSLKYLLKS